MPRKGHRRPVPWDRSEPGTLAAMLGQYQLWMTPRFSQTTVRVRDDQLRPFLLWTAERSVLRPQEVTRPMLEAYLRHLVHYRKKGGEPLSIQTRSMRISALKSFFSWMTRQNFLLFNPASELELPRTGRQLPRHVLTLSEVEAVLCEPDLEDPIGIFGDGIPETGEAFLSCFTVGRATQSGDKVLGVVEFYAIDDGESDLELFDVHLGDGLPIIWANCEGDMLQPQAPCDPGFVKVE